MIDINQRQNLLLSALPLPDYKRLSAQLEVVHLPQGMVLCQVGGTLNYAYFPSTAIISLMCATENGGCAETAVIGDEGMRGIGHHGSRKHLQSGDGPECWIRISSEQKFTQARV